MLYTTARTQKRVQGTDRQLQQHQFMHKVHGLPALNGSSHRPLIVGGEPCPPTHHTQRSRTDTARPPHAAEDLPSPPRHTKTRLLPPPRTIAAKVYGKKRNRCASDPSSPLRNSFLSLPHTAEGKKESTVYLLPSLFPSTPLACRLA